MSVCRPWARHDGRTRIFAQSYRLPIRLHSPLPPPPPPLKTNTSAGGKNKNTGVAKTVFPRSSQKTTYLISLYRGTVRRQPSKKLRSFYSIETETLSLLPPPSLSLSLVLSLSLSLFPHAGLFSVEERVLDMSCPASV